MPLYEYRCEECGEKFEMLVSFTKSDDMECPGCGSKQTQKLISAFATIGGSGTPGSSSGSCGGGSSPFR